MGTLRSAGARPRGRALSETGRWRLQRRAGTPRSLHRWSNLAPVAAAPVVRVCQALGPAVVLGSTQPAGDVDESRCAALGLDLFRRRSGGGAVLVLPGSQLWVDVFVPRTDPLYVADVSASSRWLGEAWAGAISDAVAAIAAPEVLRRSPKSAPALARTLCFAGAVAGEVFLSGRKVVGLSQRRDRDGAWFHSMALLELDPTQFASVLSGGEPDRLRAAQELGQRAAGLPGARSVAPRLEQSLLARIVSL